MNRELLWQADKNTWARHAPVLFPIVGKLKNNTFMHNGRSFHLPQHGFARDKNFKIVEKTATQVVFKLIETEETLSDYPFAFELLIRYSLEDDAVKCTYTVSNTADEDLLFSIGAHPGFRCPVWEDENLSDYTIAFEDEESSQRRLLQDGLFNHKKEVVFSNANSFRLHSGLFEKDAIVLDELKSSSLRLFSNRYSLEFSWFNMPYFGIWTKKADSGFVCLEPWAGLADSVDSTGNLSEKEGIIRLQKNEQYVCGFSFAAGAAE